MSTEPSAVPMFALATSICGYIRASLAPAVNLSLSDGAEAGQDIPHLHLQVIPRHREDQGTMPLPRTSTSVDLQETARVLRSLGRPRSH
uniref:HIT family protein n=1 Tax=uncultured Micrococcus sp. TaxID=114051 RepID=UPI00343DAD60